MGLLSNILKIQTQRNRNREMSDYIKSRLDALKVDYREDSYGNIFALKGDANIYPAFACHMDTGQAIRADYNIVRTKKKHVWLAYAKGKDSGAALPNLERLGIGGDNKCGIYLCLRLLEKLKHVKVVFYISEALTEINDLSFYEDCQFVISCSRQGNSDIVVKVNNDDLCSQRFAEELVSIGKPLGYKLATGKSCIVGNLKAKGLKISAANISAGFYYPRTKNEAVVEADLFKAFEFLRKISRELTEQFPHHPKQSYSHETHGSAGGTKMCEDCKYTVVQAEAGRTRLCWGCFSKRQLTLKCKAQNCVGRLVTESELIDEVCYFHRPDFIGH